MLKALPALLLFGSVLSADDIGDRKAIEAVIGSLYSPQVRADPTRMAELTTADLDGDLDSIPIRSVWCETACEGFNIRSLKFVTTDVAIVDAETTVGMVSISAWLMILKRDGPLWRIASFRSFGGPSRLVRANGQPPK